VTSPEEPAPAEQPQDAAEAASAGAGTLTRRHRRLLGLLGTATFFEGYDRFLIALALPYIARDMAAAEGELGWALSAIRGGALGALLLGRAADRFGRRRLLVLTVTAYTVMTAATGLSTGLIDLVIFQVVANAFLTTELALAQVVIAEEFPASARGRGQGLLGAAQAAGSGFSAAIIPAMVDTALGWRGLYFIGIGPLLLVSFLRRSLPETQRWDQLAHHGQPPVSLWRDYRTRMIILMLVSAAAGSAFASSYSFASYRATTVFGWNPGEVSVMVVIGGGLGFTGWLVLGRVADRIGRRPLGIVMLTGVSGAVALFYQSPYLFAAFGMLVFMEAGATIALTSLSTELFPTAVRATARAWVFNASVLGAALGLAAVGALAERAGGHAEVIAVVGCMPALFAPLLFFLPETRHRELEATSAA
jgi:MFS family permease